MPRGRHRRSLDQVDGILWAQSDAKDSEVVRVGLEGGDLSCRPSASGPVGEHTDVAANIEDGRRACQTMSKCRRRLVLSGDHQLVKGLDVAPVLGSRSTDTLAWVGPPRVQQAAVLPLGDPHGPPRPVDVAAPDRPDRPLRLHPGPRLDWFTDDAMTTLCRNHYTVSADSNRVGLRLTGPALTRRRSDELPSEGLVAGSVQVPPDGRPVLFLADHPTTGGYPVVAVVDAGDLPRCAQLGPGDPVRFSTA